MSRAADGLPVSHTPVRAQGQPGRRVRGGAGAARGSWLLCWLGLLALLWLVVAGPVKAQGGPAASAPLAIAQPPLLLRYGVLASFPPYQVWPEGAPPGGSDVDMVRELARAAGLALELVRYTDFARLQADLAAGRLQLASSMARTREREQRLLFTPAYTRFQLALVTPSEQPSGGLAPDLAGRSVAVVSGFASETQVDRLFPLASRVVVRDVREGLEAVRSGRADTFLEADSVISELIIRERLGGIGVVRRFDTPSGQLHLALPLALPDVAERLAVQLQALPPGRVDTLISIWSVRAPPVAAVGPWQALPGDAALVAHWQVPGQGPVVGIVGQESPFASLAADGVAQGLSVDMLNSVLQRLGVRASRFVALTPEAARDAVIQGQVDLLLGLDEAVDLAPFLRFVGPFIEYPSVLIGRPTGAVFDLEQLHGRRLALPPRSAARALVDSRHPGVEVVDCADVQACIDLVAAGGADATLADVVAAASTMARRPRSDVQIVGAEPQLRRAHSLAVHARHARAVPLVKRALDHAVDTEMDTLKQRWFSRPMQADVLRSLAWRYLPWALGTLLLLAALWAWHAARLRAEVHRTRSARQQAERADQASRRLLAFLAHEVRNSLHAVVAGVDLLRDGTLAMPPGAAAPGPQLAGALADSARATLHLLNNLIDRDRLDSGHLVLRTEPSRLSTLVDAVVREMAPAAQQRGLQLLQSAPQDDPLLALDGLRLQQVVRNLLANAIKYSPKGRIDVATRAEPVPGSDQQAQGNQRWRVQVSVSDQGPGIPASLRDPNGFSAGGAAAQTGAGEASDSQVAPSAPAAAGAPARPSERGPGSRGPVPFTVATPASGSGLGLPLCRDLARVMGGQVVLTDRPEGGTRATLVFETDAMPAPPALQEPALNVLVVEDAEAYGLLLQRGFELRGHPTRLAGTVAEALRLLQEAPCDLLLTDYHLGKEDAGALMAALAALEGGAGAAVRLRTLLMTADLHGLPPVLTGPLGPGAVLAKSEDVRQLVARALQAARMPVGGTAAPRDAFTAALR